MVNRVRKINPDGTKLCAKCRVTKQPSEFHKKPGGCGLSPYCRKCKVAGNRERAKGFTWSYTEKDLARYMAKFTRDADGCHIWNSSIGRHGYGLFYLNGRQLSAHRIGWFLAGNGPPPDFPYVLDHICRKPPCVNVNHLRVVTQEANCMELARPTPFWRNKSATACIRGHAYTDDNLAIKKTKNGRATRVCLVCVPSAWMYSILPRERPPGAHCKAWRGPYQI